MTALFIIICILIIGLVGVMFIVLKNTVTKVNEQTKTYFVDKLQEYDSLIDEKEAKLKKLNEEIKNKKNDNNFNDARRKSGYEFDSEIIDLFNSTDYQDKDVFELSKRIDKNFVIDYEGLIKDFLSFVKEDNKYNFCKILRKKFSSKEIYKLKTMVESDRNEYIKTVLTDEELKVYDAYKKITDENTIEGFVNYLDELVDLNNPNITVLVGNDRENYDHLSKYITTKVTDDIYRGIKIVYRNKVYDFSLNERNV